MKKIRKVLLILALVLVISPAAVIFAACGKKIEPTFYTVSFFDGEDVIKEVMVKEGEAATEPTKNPTKEGYEFIGWSVSFDEVKSDLTITATYAIKTYEVKFIYIDENEEEKVIDTQTVTYGSAATAPEAPEIEGYDFNGWNKSFKEVKSDLTITATYAIKTYEVKFIYIDENEEEQVIETQTVAYGSAATAPANPTREGYDFNGWNKSFKEVKSDLTITATYAIKTYEVKFIYIDEDGEEQVIETQTVAYGSAATAPEAPEREGYYFTGWDMSFEEITSVLVVTVTAQYEEPIKYGFLAVFIYDDDDNKIEVHAAVQAEQAEEGIEWSMIMLTLNPDGTGSLNMTPPEGEGDPEEIPFIWEEDKDGLIYIEDEEGGFSMFLLPAPAGEGEARRIAMPGDGVDYYLLSDNSNEIYDTEDLSNNDTFMIVFNVGDYQKNKSLFASEGDKIYPPEIDNELFIGWDIELEGDGYITVTGNLVITAQYDIEGV